MKIGRTAAFGILVGFLSVFSAYGQEPNITAEVSSTDISINDAFTLKIDITGVKNIPSPGRLDLPGFDVQSAGKTSSFQFINGQTSSLTSFRYVLRPTQTGTLQIPPIRMMLDGRQLTTDPINISVHPGNSASASSTPQNDQKSAGPAPAVPSEGLKPIFMTATIDKSRAYVGEQILLTVQFLRKPTVRLAAQPRYSEPDMTGFIVENLKQNEYNTSLHGQPYSVTELRYALFPTSDGDFAIGNATIDLAVRSEPDPFNPNSFFESFFGQSQRVRLNTRAIPVHVRALPADKPADFTGAVGRYQIKAKTDTTSPEVGKPLNLIVTIEGVGNINALKEPDLPSLPSFRTYETLTKKTINREGKVLYGKKEFKTLMIPQVSGELRIPSFSMSNFDPSVPGYVTHKTKEIVLNVQPGTISSAESTPTFSAQKEPPQEGIKVVERDIRFLKSGPIEKARPPMVRTEWFLALNSFPPLFAVAALLVRIRTRRRTLFAADYRSKEAYAKSRRALKSAAKLIKKDSPAPYYGALVQAMNGFLSDKLGLAVSGLTLDQIETILRDKGVNDATRKEIRSLISEADVARFAPSTFIDGNRKSSFNRVKILLKNLNRSLR